MVEGRFKKGCFTVFKDFPYLVHFILAYGAAVPRLLFRVIPGTFQGGKKDGCVFGGQTGLLK